MIDDQDAATTASALGWSDYIVVRLPDFDAIVADAIGNAVPSDSPVDVAAVRAWLVSDIGRHVAALFAGRSEFSEPEFDELAASPGFDHQALTALLTTKGVVGVAVAHKLAAVLRDSVPRTLEERLRAGEFRCAAENGDRVGRSNESSVEPTVAERIPAEYDRTASSAGSKEGVGLPPYPRPAWATDRWWASPTTAETSRDEFAGRWVRRSAAPKPRVKEYRDELLGWSGLVSERSWVRGRYGATAMILAKTSIELDSPDAWNALTLLYCEFVDSLARFSASFAALAHRYCPAPLPNLLIGAVKCYEMKVPPHVRRAMSMPMSPEGVGGVVETAGTATSFCGDPEARTADYLPLALRKYASVLTEKFADLADWPDAVQDAFEVSLARLAPYGDPDSLLRESTTDEERTVDALLLRLINSDAWVRAHPALPEAYARARKTLLRWITEGRDVTDATILYKKLRSARLDEARKEARTSAREHALDPSDLEFVDVPVESSDESRVDQRALLARVRASLVDFRAPEPGGIADCWEKRWALGLLDSELPSVERSSDIRKQVGAAWRRAAPTARARPAGAACSTAAGAAGYVAAMLFLALASVATHRDLPPVFGESATEAAARRYAEIERIIDAQRGEEGEL